MSGNIEETLDYAPNYAHVIELDITPRAGKPTFAWAQRGILTCTPESDETTSDDDYYHLLGNVETSIDKIKVAIAMSGHRMYGDPAQDFVQSRALLVGKDRKTRYRWTMPDGTILMGECTLAELVPGSGMGESSSKGDFSYKICLNTIDEKHKGDESAMPTSVALADITVEAGASLEAKPTVMPEKTNQRCHFAIEDTSVATVDLEGNVTGIAEGETNIIVKCAAKPSIHATAKVVVTAATVMAATKAK